MRLTFSLVILFLIVGAIVFWVIRSPEPVKPKLSVVRVDVTNQKRPILHSDLMEQSVLDSFPARENWPENVTEEVSVSGQTQQAPLQTDVVKTRPKAKGDMTSDLNRLLALIDDWVYIDYSEMTTRSISSKTGKINQTLSKSILLVHEGERLDNGLEVIQLNEKLAMLRLGEATFPLRLTKVPDFFDDVLANPRPYTPEEQEQAFDYYMKRFGDKFKKRSEGYVPPHGQRMPEPATESDQQAALKKYAETYASQFMQNAKPNPPGFPYGQQNEEAYIKYWDTFHPGKRMPDYRSIYNLQTQLGPGTRIQPNSTEN